MSLALYARVSTEDQALKYGLEAQLHELRARAEALGARVLGEYVDDGHSGGSLDRPALTRLRDAVRAGEVRHVLVHDPDRLARNLAHQLILADEIARAGARLEFITTPNEDSAEGRLLLNVKGVVAEYEREKIRERTLRGKREKARRGLIVAGPTPYGYRPDPAAPGKLVIDEEQAGVVRMLYRWLTEEHRSIRSMVAELRRLGLRSSRNGQWAIVSVRRMLTNEIYAGRAYFNRRKRQGNTSRLRDRAEWIAVPVPPIVPRETFDQAQRQLERNVIALAGRPARQRYLLRGLLKGPCGYRFGGEWNHGRQTYRCPGRDRILTARDCSCPAIAAEPIDTLVWESVAALLADPARLLATVETYSTRLGVREVEVRSSIGQIERALAVEARREGRLLDLLMDDTLAPVEGIRARLVSMQKRKTALAEQLAAARVRLAQQVDAEAHHDAIRRFCAAAVKGIDRLNLEGRQRLLRLVVDDVVYRRETVEINMRIPVAPRGETVSRISMRGSVSPHTFTLAVASPTR